MKILSAVLFLIFGLTACGRIENFTNLTQQKIETEKTETEQPDEPPILEIVYDLSGWSTITGRTLTLNLYENGVIEFESVDEKKQEEALAKKGNAVSIKYEDICTLKRAKISREELQRFLDLLNSEEFQNVKSDYSGICRTTDVSQYHRISFQNGGRQKIINLSGYCGEEEVRNPNLSMMLDFPQVLVDLFALTGKTRLKYISEKSSNQPE